MKRIVLVLCFLCLISFFVPGCGGSKKSAAKLTALQGKVEARTSKEQAFAAASKDMLLSPGGAVRTGADSSARLMVLGNSVKIDLGASSFFEVAAATDKIGLQQSGKAIFDVNSQQKSISVETQHGVTAVLGTTFGQKVSSSSFELQVSKGKVEFTNKAGEKRQVAAGQKLAWETEKPLPEVTQANLLESESFFGSGEANFEMFRR